MKNLSLICAAIFLSGCAAKSATVVESEPEPERVWNTTELVQALSPRFGMAFVEDDGVNFCYMQQVEHELMADEMECLFVPVRLIQPPRQSGGI